MRRGRDRRDQRTGPVGPDRRADGAELHPAPLGVATLTRAVRRCNRRHECPDRRHPQDDARHARARKAGGARWRRLQSPNRLFDGVMIKDNHIAALGGDRAIGEAVRRARAAFRTRSRSRSRSTNLDQLDAGARRPARRSSCSTTCRSRGCARRGDHRRPGHSRSVRRRQSVERCARLPRPEST